MAYADYKMLKLNRPEPGILEIAMGREGKLSVADAETHRELTEIWRDVDADPDTSVAIIRGLGKGYSGGGSLDLVETTTRDFDARARVWREARDLVYNLINCSKIVVSAMHGPAVGAGLVTGLLADISIAARNARIIDGHTRLGVAAGDHAAIVWPLLCGMAKAKYYLLLCDEVSGEEAERIGLVSLCVDESELAEKALEVARRLARGSQSALRWTKYSLNNWRRARPSTLHSRSRCSASPGPTCAKGCPRCARSAPRASIGRVPSDRVATRRTRASHDPAGRCRRSGLARQSRARR
jgi:enoyl-CoA hydratase